MSEGVAGFGGGRGGGRWQTLRTALNGRPGAWQGGGIGLGDALHIMEEDAEPNEDLTGNDSPLA